MLCRWLRAPPCVAVCPGGLSCGPVFSHGARGCWRESGFRTESGRRDPWAGSAAPAAGWDQRRSERSTIHQTARMTALLCSFQQGVWQRQCPDSQQEYDYLKRYRLIESWGWLSVSYAVRTVNHKSELECCLPNRPWSHIRWFAACCSKTRYLGYNTVLGVTLHKLSL